MEAIEYYLIISVIIAVFICFIIKIFEFVLKKSIMKYVILLFLISSIALYGFIYLSNYDGCGGFIFIFIFLIDLLLIILSLIGKLYKKFKE